MISMKKFRYWVLTAVANGKGLPTKKLRDGLIVIAAFAGIAGLIALTDPPKSGAAPAASNVIVVNTPLPVSGTVGISGTPNVNVSNMPIVGIDSLNNTVNLLRAPELPARQPFAAQFQCTIPDGQDRCQDSAGIAVSDAKELVIEFVSFQITLPTGRHALALIISTQPFSIPQRFPFPFPPNTLPVDDGITASFAGAHQTRLYSAPSNPVYAICLRSGTYGTGSCTGSVSGYLVDVP